MFVPRSHSPEGEPAVLEGHLTPAVRPDDVLAALRRAADLDAPVPPLVTRWAQGPLVPAPGAGSLRAAVTDPLAPDRDEGAVGVLGTA